MKREIYYRKMISISLKLPDHRHFSLRNYVDSIPINHDLLSRKRSMYGLWELHSTVYYSVGNRFRGYMEKWNYMRRFVQSRFNLLSTKLIVSTQIQKTYYVVS